MGNNNGSTNLYELITLVDMKVHTLVIITNIYFVRLYNYYM